MNAMTRYFPIGFLTVNGLMYCYLALLFVLAPLQWFAALGIELQDPLGYTELKTMYIGLMSALGIFSLLAASRRELRVAGILLAAISYFLLALVRSWGVLIDGVFDQFTLLLLFAELGSLLAALVSWYCVARTGDYSPA